jgi:putative intracellular protease/amidase
MSKKVLMVLPSKDFDTTETSVPWKVLSEGGIQVEFCTEDGKPGECDPLLLSGVIFGQLGASPETKKIYEEMKERKEFKEPKKYKDVDFMLYDALLLPGGHAPGNKMRMG